MAYPNLQFPQPDLKLARKNGIPHVWDVIRKKWLKLTPEEWVRQHAVHWLISNGYPIGLFRTELGINFHQKDKRADIAILDRNGEYFMLIECKAPSVPLSEHVWNQALTYNQILNAQFVMLTNGLQHVIAKKMPHGAYEHQEALPIMAE